MCCNQCPAGCPLLNEPMMGQGLLDTAPKTQASFFFFSKSFAGMSREFRYDISSFAEPFAEEKQNLLGF